MIRDWKSDFKFPRLLMDAVRYLKNNKDLIICKADKGGKVVVTDKTIYNNKMQDILRDTNAYTELRSNPLKSWQQSFNKQIKSLLKNHVDLERNFRSFMPSLPMMYGLPKIHKENVPMRPIISTVNSVNYKLASWLSKHLTPFLNKISGCHLINTIDFTDKIRNVNIDKKKFVSFDVDSLYTNVPVSECLQLLEQRLPTLNVDLSNLPLPFDIFMKLVRICVSDCNFSYNDRFYKQIRGLPMGSPISPIIANLFMEIFESNVLSDILDNLICK